VVTEHLLVDLIENGVIVAFILSVLFPAIGIPKIGYWPWWKNEFGWNVIFFDATVALALLGPFLHRVIGLNPDAYAFLWIDTVAIWLIPVSILWRCIAIWRTQRYRK
jgi:hypothetical protein